MMEKYLICTVGLPRSGKTTWARKQGFPIVNPDSIRLVLHGTAFRREAEDFVWAIARIMVELLFLAGYDVVILDATNTTIKSRATWVNNKWNTYFKVIMEDVEECKQRARDENRYDLIKVIEKMFDQFEALQRHENNYDENKSLFI